MSDKPRIITQPHLGKPQTNYKPHEHMGGYLALAKVLKVHHKHSTVDVQVINTNDIFSCSVATEGKFAARMGSTNAGFDPITLSSYGVIEPVTEGQIVLLAFLDENKSRPIILTSFHDTERVERNILPSAYPINPNASMFEYAEALKYLRVFPSQLYQRVDGVGGLEISLPSKTFLKIDSDPYDLISDLHGAFDHWMLSEKDPTTNMSRSGKTESTLLPIKLLFTHRSNFDDDSSTYTKFFIDKDGTFRLSRDPNNGSLSYFQMLEDGTVTLSRQSSNNIPTNGVRDSSEIILLPDGSLELRKNTESGVSSYKITKHGEIYLAHQGGSSISLTNDGNISLNPVNQVIIGGSGYSSGGGSGGSGDLSGIENRLDDLEQRLDNVNGSGLELGPYLNIGNLDGIRHGIVQMAEDGSDIFRMDESGLSLVGEIKKESVIEQIDGTALVAGELVKKITYKVEIISSNGLIFKNGKTSTVLYAKVYQGMTEVTDTINAARFRWTRVSSDQAGDTKWNTAHFGGTKQITLTTEDVYVRATFNCEILDEQ